MPSVADLVEPDRLPDLATPANLRLGREIAAAGAIEFLDFGPMLVRGKVGGPAINSQTRTTELRSVGGQLQWVCTCSSEPPCFASTASHWPWPHGTRPRNVAPRSLVPPTAAVR